MRNFIAASLLLIAFPALAQSPGTVHLLAPSNSPGAPRITQADQINNAVNEAMRLKADVTFVGSQRVTQLVSNAAYGTGQAVGGLLTFTAAARLPSSSGSVQGMTISLPDAQIPTLDVILFTAPPTSSTITNRTAVSISPVDQISQIGVLHISDCTGSQTVCQAQQSPLPFVLPVSQTTLYGVIVARNAFTPSNLPVGAPAWAVTLLTQQN